MERRTPAYRRRQPATRRSLPFAGACQLANLPDDDVALQPAQAIHEQRAVQMIHLVLERTREQSRSLDLLGVAVTIEALQHGMRGPDHRRIESRDAQAAFFLELHPVALNELRVDEGEETRRIAPDRHVHDEDPQRNANLWGGEPHTRRGVHRLDHVVDQTIDLRRDGLHRQGTCVEGRVAVSENGPNHRGRLNAELAEPAEPHFTLERRSRSADAGWQAMEVEVDEQAELEARGAENGRRFAC